MFGCSQTLSSLDNSWNRGLFGSLMQHKGTGKHMHVSKATGKHMHLKLCT